MEKQTQICFDVDTEGLITTKHRITAIGVKCEDDERVFTSPDEAEILESFWQYLEDIQNYVLIGFNCAVFDVPFLMIRSMKHGIKFPELAGRVLDLRLLFSNGNKRMKGTLEDFARMLGYEPQYHGFCAAHIPLYWEGDFIEEIEENLLQDVRMTYSLFLKAKGCGII